MCSPIAATWINVVRPLLRNGISPKNVWQNIG